MNEAFTRRRAMSLLALLSIGVGVASHGVVAADAGDTATGSAKPVQLVDRLDAEISVQAGALVYALDAPWPTVATTGSVLRLEPATGQVDEVVSGLASPAQITAGPDALWVTLRGGEDKAEGDDTQVARIDPGSGEVTAFLTVGGSPQGGADVLAGSDSLLVRSTSPWLTRLDPESGEVIETIVAEPDVDPSQGPLPTAFGSIWTVNVEQDSMYRLPAEPACEPAASLSRCRGAPR